MYVASKPQKVAKLIEVIAQHLDTGRYLDTVHATQRRNEREITRSEILHVLRHGYHEKSKDTFEEAFNAWNYAVRGKTVDKKELRVIVSFDVAGMLIITAIELEK